MFRHLMKLIWKRKSRNLMLSLEILLAFLLVFGIAAFGTRCYQLYTMPTGITTDDVWSVSIEVANNVRVKDDPQVLDRFKRALMDLPEVERVAFSNFPPFANSRMTEDFVVPGGAKVGTDEMEVSDDYFAVTGTPLVEGHGFSAADDGATALPVVINRRLAKALFPGQSALGKAFVKDDRNPAKRTPMKVVGIVDEYRTRGELTAPDNFALVRWTPKGDDPQTILLKLKPGVPRAFESALVAKLKLVHNDWGYAVSPLSDMRATMLREDLIPLVVLSVIAAFLLVMVAFGLFGVLWQNTTLRIPEIGLRRAVGAGAGDIYRQIIGEQLLLSSFGMLIALVLLVQLPITGALGEALSWGVFGAATALSMGMIYLLSLLCALYPGWRASRLSPTQALHYE